jgi:hypothetical protein
MQWCLPFARQQAGNVDSVDTAKSGPAHVHAKSNTSEMASVRRIKTKFTTCGARMTANLQ